MPVDENSIVYNLIKKQGAGAYHICYESDNFNQDINLLRNRGYVPLGEVMPAPAIDNVKAAFFFHIHFGIVELIETL